MSLSAVAVVVSLTLLARPTAGQAPQLALTFCSAARAASQLWAFDAANTTLVLASNGLCIDILAWGTSPGSEAYTAPCHHDDRDPTHQNQEWSAPASSPPGAPLVQTMAKLPLDACGDGGAVPGALLTLCAVEGAGAFWLNASAPGGPGTLVHSASGLCVDAASPPATGSLDVVLNACSDAPAVAQRQVFVLAANGAPDFIALATPSISGAALCLTAGAGAGVVAAACAPPGGGAAPQSQSFVLDAQGHLVTGFAPLVADAGPDAPYYRGAATALSAASAASVFSLNSSGHAAGTGRLVHAASGLCLDAGGVPTSHGCLDRAARALPFCDNTRPIADRVADLVSRLTLAEKIGLTGADLKKDGSCDTKDPGVPRLGVPPMQWLVETNSMAASACYNGSCATSFPSAQNLAASFNRTVFNAKGAVVSSEMRALNNLQWHRADGVPDSMQSLSGFGPDINQPRDPRNGRAGELPTEDRFLMAAYAVEYVRGCQESGSPYLKMITGLKVGRRARDGPATPSRKVLTLAAHHNTRDARRTLATLPPTLPRCNSTMLVIRSRRAASGARATFPCSTFGTRISHPLRRASCSVIVPGRCAATSAWPSARIRRPCQPAPTPTFCRLSFASTGAGLTPRTLAIAARYLTWRTPTTSWPTTRTRRRPSSMAAPT